MRGSNGKSETPSFFFPKAYIPDLDLTLSMMMMMMMIE